ncbi:hypothetical protein HW555_002674 [Spodoptera exigua]|uniref:Uncharacterized protein n=1 Tax=Spodoptera exigua TaxID=7107 RepID=A0A835GMX9_SPOEX|nr:hypothetical protein HW555_002674 [Spodoptera exigua]
MVLEISSYKSHSTLHSIAFTQLPSMRETTHSEYYLGRCVSLSKEIIWTEHFSSEDIRGKMMIQGFLNYTEPSPKLPSCIRIKSVSSHTDMVRYNSYQFTLCFGRITLYYMAEWNYFHYYEWFLPLEMQDGMNWTMYFYRSHKSHMPSPLIEVNMSTSVNEAKGGAADFQQQTSKGKLSTSAEVLLVANERLG